MPWRRLVFLLLSSICAHAHAQENCPWLTQGTAAALMGGPVTASVHASNGVGICAFLLNAGSGAGAAKDSLLLKINVSLKAIRDCTTGEPLKGVGQDSFRCASDSRSEHRELIRGHVRQKFFQVALTARGASASDKVSLRSSLQQAAEEVAGSLF